MHEEEPSLGKYGYGKRKREDRVYDISSSGEQKSRFPNPKWKKKRRDEAAGRRKAERKQEKVLQ